MSKTRLQRATGETRSTTHAARKIDATRATPDTHDTDTAHATTS